MDRERLNRCKDTLQRNGLFEVLAVIEQLERENEILEGVLIEEQSEQEFLRREIEQLRAKLGGGGE